MNKIYKNDGIKTSKHFLFLLKNVSYCTYIPYSAHDPAYEILEKRYHLYIQEFVHLKTRRNYVQMYVVFSPGSGLLLGSRSLLCSHNFSYHQVSLGKRPCHLCVDKIGLEFSFSLNVDNPSTGAQVTQCE